MAYFVASTKYGTKQVSLAPRPVPWDNVDKVQAVSDNYAIIDGILHSFDPSAPTILTAVRKASGISFVDVMQAEHCVAALTREGHIYTWTDGESAGSTYYKGPCFRNNAPEKVQGPLEGKTVTQFSVDSSEGGGRIAVVTRDGGLFTWGYGKGGALCHGDEEDQEVPRKVEFFNDLPIQYLTSGGGRLAVITVGGFLYVSGLSTWELQDLRETHAHNWKAFAEAGAPFTKLAKRIGTPTRVEVKGGKFVDASLATNKIAAVTDVGVAYCWALDGKAEWTGHDGKKIAKEPKALSALKGQKVLKVWLTGTSGAALTQKGRVWTWGIGDCLGHPGKRKVMTPKKVLALCKHRILKVFWTGRFRVMLSDGIASHSGAQPAIDAAALQEPLSPVAGKRSRRDDEEKGDENLETTTNVDTEQASGKRARRIVSITRSASKSKTVEARAATQDPKPAAALTSIENLGQC